MSNATLDQIESAMYAQLGTLVTATPTTTAPFRHLRRWAGEVSRDLAYDLERGLYDLTPEQLPAALFAWEREDPLGDNGAFLEEHQQTEVVGRSTWRVYVVVRDLQGDAAALKGNLAGQPGALLCAHAVKTALAGFQIAGLFENRGVRWLGSAPWSIARRTAYVYVVRFATDAALDAATADENPTPGTPLGGLRGDVVDATPDTNSATVSLATFDDRF